MEPRPVFHKSARDPNSVLTLAGQTLCQLSHLHPTHSVYQSPEALGSTLSPKRYGFLMLKTWQSPNNSERMNRGQMVGPQNAGQITLESQGITRFALGLEKFLSCLG